MSNDVEATEKLLEGVLTNEGDWSNVEAILSRMPEGESRATLERFARICGSAAVPLLERLVRETQGPAARSAVQALGSVAIGEAAAALRRASEDAPSSELRKAARRALHRLSSVGVQLTAQRAPEPERAPERAAQVHRTIASPIDGAGNRVIWFAFNRGGDIEMVSVLINDEQGVKDAYVRESSLARFDRESKKLLVDEEYPWIEMPTDYCRHLVDQAHRRNAASGAPLPVEFLAWREEIAHPEGQYDQPLVYSVVSAAEVRWNPRYLDNSGNLFELDLFSGWILDRDDLTEFVDERLSAERSGLVLAGVSGEARDRAIEERAIQRIFDARRCALLKRRLEETSYLLWKLGRLEAAREALAAALAMEPGSQLPGHPFVRAMVEWSLEVVTEMARGERTRSVRPGVRLHLPY